MGFVSIEVREEIFINFHDGCKERSGVYVDERGGGLGYVRR